MSGICAGLMAGLLLAPSPAAAQVSRAGVTKQLIPGVLLFGDVAHDPRNDVYLSVMAWGTVWAAFANNSGDVISTFTTGPALPGGFANNPRVAYSPDLNGGAGGFLVTWHEAGTGPNFVHSAVVSYPGGVVAIDPGGVNVSGGAVSAPTAGGPSLAYSPEAKKFLVTWTGDGYAVRGRLVNGVTGVPEGGVITVGPINTRDPAVAWNPRTQEFGVGFAGFGAYMALARVNTAGGVIPASGPFGQSTGTFNTALAVNAAGRYVLGWAAPGGSFSMELDSSGTPLASFPTLISSQLGTPTSFAFALNPVSGTILAVSEGVGTREVPGVEMNSAGVPLGTAVPLTDGAGATGAGGSYAPRVGARQTGKQWSISYSRYNAGYGLANQIVATGSGSLPVAPPTITSHPKTIVARLGTTVTFTAAATGSTAVQWQVKPRTAGDFVDVPGATSASFPIFVTSNDAGKLIRAKFSNSGGAALTTAAALVVSTTRSDFDGDGRSDVVVWRPSTGTWFGATAVTTNALQTGITFGALGDQSLTGDIDGDGIADIVIFRPQTGQWFWLTSSTGYDQTKFGTVTWGGAGDVPLLADIDGDGRSDITVWRPSTGDWFWLKSSSNNTAGGNIRWGGSGDVPLLADVDGDGLADITVFRPSTGDWFWLKSSSNNTAGGTIRWGGFGDRPLLGDFDGDGQADITVFRPSTGQWFWVTSTSAYTAGFTTTWGGQGDQPLLADFDGDGKSEIGVFRASTGGWYWLESSTGWRTQGTLTFGGAGDVVMVR